MKKYTVLLGEESKPPKYTCLDFQRIGMPGKHFFAVIASTGSHVEWDDLPPSTESVFFNLDPTVVLKTGTTSTRDTESDQGAEIAGYTGLEHDTELGPDAGRSDSVQMSDNQPLLVLPKYGYASHSNLSHCNELLMKYPASFL